MINQPFMDEAPNMHFIVRFQAVKTFGCGSSVSPRWIRHPYLIYVLEGEGEAVIDEAAFRLSPGKLLLLLPGHHARAQFRQTPVRMFMIRFSCLLPEASAGADRREHDLLCPDIALCPANMPQVEVVIEKLMKHRRDRHPLERWQCGLRFQELAYTIACGMHESAENGKSGHTESAIEQVMAYMKEHYARPLSMKQLAAAHGISPTNFAAAFKRHAGMTPVEYLTRLRIEQSKQWLVPQQRLSAVALKAGYQDELYFSRIFKRLVGVAPTVYMKNRSADHIMTIDPILNDYLVALDIEPVATVPYEGGAQINGLLPYIADRLAPPPFVGSWRQPDLNSALAISPKLVLGIEQHNKQAAPSMNQVAPTLLISLHQEWRQSFYELAGLTERKEAFRLWLRRFEAKAAELRRQLHGMIGAGKTMMVLIAAEDGLRVYGGRRQLGELLYRQLALRPPAGIRLDEHYRTVEVEDLSKLDPDYVFLSTPHWGHGEERKRLLKESRVWESLRAVQHDRVFEVESWMNNHAPLSSAHAMEQIMAHMLDAH